MNSNIEWACLLGVWHTLTMISSTEEPECSKCHATSSPIWRRNDDGTIVCLDCHSSAKRLEKERSSESTPQPQTTCQSSTSGNHSYKKGKKGGKKGYKGDKSKNSSGVVAQISSGASRGIQKSRRTLCQSKPVKAIRPEPMVRTSDSVVFKGMVYEVGDVVSVMDYSGGIYYAMIRGFLVDQYANQMAVLTWLLPKMPNPSSFDPSQFILGPEEDEPRHMELLEFVCHSAHSRSFFRSFHHTLEHADLWLPSRTFP